MPKLLVLAYEFPPYISVAGLRPLSWAKYANEFGFEVTIVTRQWDTNFGDQRDYIAPSKSSKIKIEKTNSYTTIAAPYFPSFSNQLLLKHGEQKFRFVRKALTASLEIFQFFLPIGTKRTLYSAAKKQLKSNSYDFILATGDPFVLFHYAALLSKQHRIPWVADYRDTWSNDISINRQYLFKFISRYIEKRTLKSCLEVTTVSAFIAQKIAEIIPKKAHVLPNGYDPEVITKHEQKKQSTTKLTIAHAGSIFNWHPYQLFLKSIANYLTKYPDKKLEIRFYGLNKKQEIEKCIEQYPVLNDVVKILPKLPNEELIGALKSCNLMLLFNYYSFMGTKIYDYLAVKRTILLCFDKDEEALKLKAKHYTIEEPKNLSNTLQKDLIKAYNAGYTVENHKDLEKLLLQFDDEFQTKVEIAWLGNNTEEFSRKNQVKKLCEILNSSCI